MPGYTGEGLRIFTLNMQLLALEYEVHGIRMKGGRISAMKRIKELYPQFKGCRTRKDLLKAFEPFVTDESEKWQRAGCPGLTP